MNIISYRGPGKGGGVSTALERLFKNGNNGQSWWYLDSGKIKCCTHDNLRVFKHSQLSQQLSEAHYRYANEFIWPLMHNLPEYAVYRAADHFLYNRFNKILGNEVMELRNSKPYFIQDYQLGLLPKIFKNQGLTSAIFWHIPWPNQIPECFLAPVIELAESLLEADLIGFHTKEYAKNFRIFVRNYVSRAPVNINYQRHLHLVGQPLTNRFSSLEKGEIIAAPLGLDHQYWASMPQHRIDKLFHPGLRLPFLLSVDRADYTKGIVNRLQSINHFFDDHGELKGKLCFVQICTPSRSGIAAYDQYWQRCQAMIEDLNSRFASDDWQPVITMTNPLSSSELASLYCNASVMVVNPLKDGLNLTAKEFIACQKEGKAGILALSRDAGVFEEFGDYAIALDPENPKEMSNEIYSCWSMPQSEKEFRTAMLTKKLKQNTLDKWKNIFSKKLERPKPTGIEFTKIGASI